MADTPVEEFLENDTPILGQNYVCLSFVSPEKFIKQKMLLALLKGLYAARADFTHFLREKRIGVVENLLLSRNITNGSGNLT